MLLLIKYTLLYGIVLMLDFILHSSFFILHS